MALGDFLFHDGLCRFFQLDRFGAAVVLLDDGPGAEQAAEEQVAAQLAVVMADGNDDAAQAVFCRGGRRETAVVGADVADGDDGVGLGIDGVEQQVFQFTQHAAASAEGRHVVALYVEFPEELLRQARKVLQRRRVLVQKGQFRS